MDTDTNEHGKQLKEQLMQFSRRIYDARYRNSWILNQPQRVRVWWFSPYSDRTKHKDFAVTEIHPNAFIAYEGGCPWWAIKKFELMS